MSHSIHWLELREAVKNVQVANVLGSQLTGLCSRCVPACLCFVACLGWLGPSGSEVFPEKTSWSELELPRWQRGAHGRPGALEDFWAPPLPWCGSACWFPLLLVSFLTGFCVSHAACFPLTWIEDSHEERRGHKHAWLSVTPLSQLAGSQFLIGKIICCSPFMQAAPPSYDVVPHHFGWCIVSSAQECFPFFSKASKPESADPAPLPVAALELLCIQMHSSQMWCFACLPPASPLRFYRLDLRDLPGP